MNYNIEIDGIDFTKCKKVPSLKNLFFGNIGSNGYILIYISDTDYLNSLTDELMGYMYNGFKSNSFKYRLFVDIHMFAYLCFSDKAFFVSNFQINLFQFDQNELLKQTSDIGIYELQYFPGSSIFIYDGYSQNFNDFIHQYYKITDYLFFNNICSYYKNFALLLHMKENDNIQFDIPKQLNLHLDTKYSETISDYYIKKYTDSTTNLNMFIIYKGLSDNTTQLIINDLNVGIVPAYINCENFMILLVFDLKLVLLTNGTISEFYIGSRNRSILKYVGYLGGECKNGSVMRYTARLYVDEGLIVKIFDKDIVLIDGKGDVSNIGYVRINNMINFPYLKNLYLFEFLIKLFAGSVVMLSIILVALKYSDSDFFGKLTQNITSENIEYLTTIIKNKISWKLGRNITDDEAIQLAKEGNQDIILDGVKQFTELANKGISEISGFEVVENNDVGKFMEFMELFDKHNLFFAKYDNIETSYHEFIFIKLTDISVINPDLQNKFFEKYGNITLQFLTLVIRSQQLILQRIRKEMLKIENILQSENTVLRNKNIWKWRKYYILIYSKLATYV